MRLSPSVQHLRTVRPRPRAKRHPPPANDPEKLTGKEEPHTLPPHQTTAQTRLRRVWPAAWWKDSLRHILSYEPTSVRSSLSNHISLAPGLGGLCALESRSEDRAAALTAVDAQGATHGAHGDCAEV